MRCRSMRQRWHVLTFLLYDGARLMMHQSWVNGMSLSLSSQIWLESIFCGPGLCGWMWPCGLEPLLEGVACESNVLHCAVCSTFVHKVGCCTYNPVDMVVFCSYIHLSPCCLMHQLSFCCGQRWSSQCWPCCCNWPSQCSNWCACRVPTPSESGSKSLREISLKHWYSPRHNRGGWTKSPCVSSFLSLQCFFSVYWSSNREGDKSNHSWRCKMPKPTVLGQTAPVTSSSSGTYFPGHLFAQDKKLGNLFSRDNLWDTFFHGEKNQETLFRDNFFQNKFYSRSKKGDTFLPGQLFVLDTATTIFNSFLVLESRKARIYFSKEVSWKKLSWEKVLPFFFVPAIRYPQNNFPGKKSYPGKKVFQKKMSRKKGSPFFCPKKRCQKNCVHFFLSQKKRCLKKLSWEICPGLVPCLFDILSLSVLVKICPGWAPCDILSLSLFWKKICPGWAPCDVALSA